MATRLKIVTLSDGRKVKIPKDKIAVLGSEIAKIGKKVIEEKIRAAEREAVGS